MINSEDVARYLAENPGFFDEHAEMLAQISVPSPHGGNAISLADRQVPALRDKVKQLESKLAELIQFGEENDAISEKMHRLCLALLCARGLAAMLSSMYYNLREDFAIPHVALRVWRDTGATPQADNVPEFGSVSDELKQYAASLDQPYCGACGNVEAAGWFGEAAPHVRSVAMMALRDGDCFGMLLLGSEDNNRFHPEMGTLYLKRLGDFAGAALARFV